MYSPFWNKTITIFTPYISLNNIKWYKYVISNVFVKLSSDKSLMDNHYVKDSRTKIRIPSNKYIAFKKWTISENKINNFTISDESIIVLDNVPDTLADNESGSYLFDKYDCSKPLRIIDNTYTYLPHISIVGD